ncbi:MAG: response regulator transcription factor [Chloroflexota bacterium]|nr:response regulator transcription factor [Chloroflexota bacterium]
MPKDRILLIEDDPAVARGLEYGLQKEGFDVLWADSGQRGLALLRDEQPHLIVLDIRLPDVSGFDLCRQMRAEGRREPILMLTARDEELDKVLGLELGADDYVIKPYSLRELLSRIRALLRRAYGDLATPAAPESLHFGDLLVDTERREVIRDGEPVELTPTEFRLLRFLATHPGRPFSRSDLIEAVWGYDSDIYNERTVDVHIRHLREKVEAEPTNPHWLVTVRGVGYMFEP